MVLAYVLQLTALEQQSDSVVQVQVNRLACKRNRERRIYQEQLEERRGETLSWHVLKSKQVLQSKAVIIMLHLNCLDASRFTHRAVAKAGLQSKYPDPTTLIMNASV